MRRTALTALYIVFFAVQFFSVTGPYNTFLATANVSCYKEPGKGKVLVDKKNQNKKSNIRLNKRFQPAIADGMINSGEDAPVKYIINNNPAKPKEYLLFSFILATSLRGPPSLS